MWGGISYCLSMRTICRTSKPEDRARAFTHLASNIIIGYRINVTGGHERKGKGCSGQYASQKRFSFKYTVAKLHSVKLTFFKLRSATGVKSMGCA